MTLSTTVVGHRTEPVEHTVDARWIMAHAAGLGLADPVHVDPSRPGGLVAHPLLSAGIEWPVVLATNALPGHREAPRSDLARGVHVAHDLRIHRPVREGDVVRTSGTVVGIRASSAGVVQQLDLVTVTADGGPMHDTRMTTIFRGVDLDGQDVEAPERPAPDSRADDGDRTRESHTESLAVGALLAHTYTEGARIWNPIHTDRRVAREVGLDDIILHGTATLALAVSASRIPVDRVRRVVARLGAPVFMPNQLVARFSGDRDVARFDVEEASGRTVLSDGLVSAF